MFLRAKHFLIVSLFFSYFYFAKNDCFMYRFIRYIMTYVKIISILNLYLILLLWFISISIWIVFITWIIWTSVIYKISSIICKILAASIKLIVNIDYTYWYWSKTWEPLKVESVSVLIFLPSSWLIYLILNA